MYQGHEGVPYLQYTSNGIEEPMMRIDLLLILGLQDKNDLNRDQIVGVILVEKDKLRCEVNRELGSVLVSSVKPYSLGLKRS